MDSYQTFKIRGSKIDGEDSEIEKERREERKGDWELKRHGWTTPRTHRPSTRREEFEKERGMKPKPPCITRYAGES